MSEFKSYRKKPVVIQACQANDSGVISTLEGDMRYEPGDWIIRGVEGEQYPCKPAIFEKTYEPAEDARAEPAASGELVERIRSIVDPIIERNVAPPILNQEAMKLYKSLKMIRNLLAALPPDGAVWFTESELTEAITRTGLHLHVVTNVGTTRILPSNALAAAIIAARKGINNG